MRIGLWTKNRGHVTETQGALALDEKSGRGPSHQRGDIGSDGQQATIAVAESESAMGLRAAHAMLEERVVINRRRSDLFVGPTFEDRYDGRLDFPSQPRLWAAVITHSCRNFGKWFRHRA